MGNERMNLLMDLVDDLRCITTLEGVSTLAGRYARGLGFEHHGFAIRGTSAALADENRYRYFHNIPEPWGNTRYIKTYGTELEKKDPLVLHAASSGIPSAFTARGMTYNLPNDLATKGQNLIRQANEYGIRAGIVAPVSAPGLQWSFLVLTTGDTDKISDVKSRLPEACYFATVLLCTTRQLISRARNVPVLTRRECEMLKWASAGKSSWETGMIMNLSEKTVDFHLQSAARKLNVRGRHAAVYRAYSLGIIAI